MPAAVAGFFFGYTAAAAVSDNPRRRPAGQPPTHFLLGDFMNRTALVVASLGLALVACRGSSSGDDVAGDDAPPSGEQHIQDVQSDAMAPATPVALKGVIVTAIDNFGAKTGDFWVEEPGGGEFSGVHVFGAPLDQVAAIAVGDIVNIAGAEKDEFALTTDMTGRTLTELKPVNGGMMSVTKTGTGTVPAPHVVDALAIAALDSTSPHPNAQDLEWEKWEGVLITVSNVSQTGTKRGFGSTTPYPEDSYKFEVNGKLVVESLLTAIPTTAQPDFCYASITGVADFFFDFLLLPTQASDFGAAGAACPTESGHASCSDGLDNDFDGFADCADFSCQSSDPACTTTTTIDMIQTGTVTGNVNLPDVFVTAISFNKKNLWVSSSLNAAANGGIYVFRGTMAPVLDASIVVGAKVNVSGPVSEYNNDTTGDTLTQIAGTGTTITFVAAPTTAPVPVSTQQASALLAAEPFESVLVTLTKVKVVTIGSATFFVSAVSQKGTTVNTPFTADDDIYRFVAADMGKCYSTITGIWSYSVFDNTYIFLPRAGTGTGPDAVLAANQTDCD
jgi:hypothetical protein